MLNIKDVLGELDKEVGEVTSGKLLPAGHNRAKLYDVEVGKSPNKGTPFINFIWSSVNPVKGCNNPEMKNHQKAENRYWVSEKTEAFDDFRNWSHFLTYFVKSDKVFRDVSEEDFKNALTKAVENYDGDDPVLGKLEVYAQAFKECYQDKEFAGLFVYTKDKYNNCALTTRGFIARDIELEKELLDRVEEVGIDSFTIVKTVKEVEETQDSTGSVEEDFGL